MAQQYITSPQDFSRQAKQWTGTARLPPCICKQLLNDLMQGCYG